jgi:hypothetical protein
MKGLRRGARWALAALFVATTAIAGPQDAAAPDTLQKLARAGGLAQHPGANILFVEKRREIRFERDGTYVDRTYLLIKLLTQPAVGYFATMPVLEYYGYRSEGEVLFARVIRPDGHITDVPADMIADVENPMYRDLNVKDSNMRLKQITFRNLQVGDAIECAVEERCLRPVTRDFELKEGKYLQEDEPVIHLRVEINGPANMPLKHFLKGAEGTDVQYRSERKGGRISHVWEASDIPAFPNEPGWDTRQHFAARLLASTISSWREVSRTEYRITEPAMDDDAALRRTVSDVTRGLKTDEQKIAAIQLFLRKNIKYKGLTSLSSYRSKPATQTLGDRFGVCRDVAVLMCAMLKAAGIRSWPAATGYNRVVDAEIPHDIFQHMIVAVPDGKNGYRLYDPTGVLYSGDGLPGYAGEAPLLVCTPRGEDLGRVPHIPASTNMGSIRATSRIGADGGLSSSVTITGRGFYDEDLRNWRKRTRPDDYTKRWRELLAQLHPAATLVDWVTSDPDDLGAAFSITLRYEVPGYAALNGGGVVLKAPVATDAFERVLVDIVARANRPQRRHPFIVTTTAGVHAQETLTFPERWIVKSVPEAISLKAANLTLAVDYSVPEPAGRAGNPGLEFSKTLLIDSRQFDPDSYLELRKVLEANSGSRKAEIVLARPQ